MGMATCKECLHVDVCYMVEHYGVDIDEDRQEYDCHQFTDRTKYAEVVRCKDCKYYKPQEKSAKWHGTVNYCTRVVSLKMPTDGFCSYGERREGE